MDQVVTLVLLKARGALLTKCGNCSTEGCLNGFPRITQFGLEFKLSRQFLLKDAALDRASTAIAYTRFQEPNDPGLESIMS